MANAQPANNRGVQGHGRRLRQLATSPAEGELCLYTGHSLGRFSTHSMRYDSHQACTRCVASAREGRMSFDLNRLLKKHRRRALKFWSQVDMGSPEDCWMWCGCINKRTKQPQFSWRRPGLASSTQHHPQRVAMWFTWGDLGYTGVKTTCGEKYCCNPFHLIPQHVGVFVDHDSYLESFELACEIHTLKQQIAEFAVEEAMKEQEKLDASAELDAREDLMLNPDTGFGERFEAVMTDILAGRHVVQMNSDQEGLHRSPADNDENPTEEF